MGLFNSSSAHRTGVRLAVPKRIISTLCSLGLGIVRRNCKIYYCDELSFER